MKEAGPATPEEVFDKYRDHLRRLKEMRDRAGDAFTDVALVQLLTTEGFVDDLARALYPTDGHGRPQVPDGAQAS